MAAAIKDEALYTCGYILACAVSVHNSFCFCWWSRACCTYCGFIFANLMADGWWLKMGKQLKLAEGHGGVIMKNRWIEMFLGCCFNFLHQRWMPFKHVFNVFTLSLEGSGNFLKICGKLWTATEYAIRFNFKVQLRLNRAAIYKTECMLVSESSVNVAHL